MYELHVHWYTGEIEIYYYDSLEIAKKRELGFYQVFGNQIEYTWIKKPR